ncbi:glycosyl hydrolase, partial [Naematelia encephala]
FYVSTDDIFDDSKWSDAVYFDEVGFDQDLLFDDDGKVYQTVTRFDFTADFTDGKPKIQSWINEIDLASGRSLTAPVLAKASALGVAEGCHIIKHEGYYYFFTAEGGTQSGHRECVYRSDSPLGPFHPPPDGINPLIYNGDHPDIQNTGHMDLIQGDGGRWIAVFLGVRPVFEAKVDVTGTKGMPTHLGRETFMATVEWVDGWPVVNNREPIELVGKAKGLSLLPEARAWVDDFSAIELQLGWYRVHVPLRSFHDLRKRPGSLAIYGSATTLDVDHSPSILLQKQPGFIGDWSTRVGFTPTQPGQEAGTVVWLHSKAYAALGIRGTKEGELEVFFRRPNAEGKHEVSHRVDSIPDRLRMTLIIEARQLEYTFKYQMDSTVKEAGRVPTSSFHPLFTGVHLGLYAQGAREVPCLNPAYFEYAKWDVPSTE